MVVIERLGGKPENALLCGCERVGKDAPHFYIGEHRDLVKRRRVLNRVRQVIQDLIVENAESQNKEDP